MSKIVTLNTPWVQLSANSTGGNGFNPATEFQRSGPVQKARMRIETRNLVGPIEITGAEGGPPDVTCVCAQRQDGPPSGSPGPWGAPL